MDLMNSRRRKRKGAANLKNPITFIIGVISLCCILILTLSALNLPGNSKGSKSKIAEGKEHVSEDLEVGKLGEIVIGFLPDDLAFTVFVPSTKAFECGLRLRANTTVMPPEEAFNMYATLSRVMAFSAVPRKLYSDSVPVGKEICLDSVSGFRLFVSKDVDGSLVVNNVKSEQVDIRKAWKSEVVVHVMDGVVMDTDFAQSEGRMADDDNG